MTETKSISLYIVHLQKKKKKKTDVSKCAVSMIQMMYMYTYDIVPFARRDTSKRRKGSVKGALRVQGRLVNNLFTENLVR